MREGMLGAMYCLASLFENFEKNVFIRESGKAILALKFQNKGGQWELQASCTLFLFGARSGRDLFPKQPGQNG